MLNCAEQIRMWKCKIHMHYAVDGGDGGAAVGAAGVDAVFGQRSPYFLQLGLPGCTPTYDGGGGGGGSDRVEMIVYW